ncbi:family 43 glycosylhydrolase [Paenibacillus methanolicus]|uniref:GH43 family beta-xylosidase n=1 Tax=Paenibacillus methanolicus TaxID=582686 RepID=A0A5S5CJT7_9BACL|nr:family 43 glycosylhydrolase [Paenibacillus methanolicus]TYP79774.1 GH43 family beta-xylosidase [Paenibacillus methanolicus]
MRKATTKRWLIGAAALIVIAIGWGGWLMNSGNNQESSDVAYDGHGGTFKNTLAEMDTPDPSVVYNDGYYYMTFTHNGADVMVMKSRTIDFKDAQRKTVWYPDVGTNYSAELWAPEIQFIQGKWYIYFAADDGRNENHRMFALQADTDDPMGSYTFKGQIADDTNKWAIDGLAAEIGGNLYFVWSGWEGDVNVQQNTYIAPMSDPLTISGPRVLLSEPELDWEKAGGPPYINEGQSILYHNEDVHIVYSGAGSWTPYYALGMLTLTKGADPLDPASWTKREQPLLSMDEEAGVFGPGHNSFTTSPDGAEQWIVYHATSGPDDGWNNRKARAQKLVWDEAGKLALGKPIGLDEAIAVPSGTGVFRADPQGAGEASFDLIPVRVNTTAPLLIHYRNASGETLKGSVSANEGEPIAIELPPADATGYAYADVPLIAGMNDIRVTASGGGAVIEAIELTRYEAEFARIGPQGEAEENAFASGGGIVKLAPGEDEGVRFPNVVVPRKGDYELRIAASNPSDEPAKLTVRAEEGKTATLEIPAGERNAFATQSVTLRLKEGVNALILEDATAELRIDYLDVMTMK